MLSYVVKILITGSFFTTLALHSFEQNPWLPEPYIIQCKPSYTYSHYPYIQGAVGSDFSSNNSQAAFLAELAFLDGWDAQCEVAFMQSRIKPFGFEDGGALVRYCFFDDIKGDPVSLVVGGNVVFVPGGRLKDPTVPYHNVSNFELMISLGKEYANESYWKTRWYAFLAAGIANKGAPWVKALATLSANAKNKIFFDLEASSYFGFGSQKQIDPFRFYGYGNVHHSSIDLAFKAHTFVWKGEVMFAYTRRLLARSFPANQNAFTLSYQFDFPL